MRTDRGLHNDASREVEGDEKDASAASEPGESQASSPSRILRPILPREPRRTEGCSKCEEQETERTATIQWLYDLKQEIIEGRPEIALESIRGAIRIHEKAQ